VACTTEGRGRIAAPTRFHASGRASAARVRAERNATEAEATLRGVADAAGGTSNLLPPMRDALRARCTVGEICGVLRDAWGTYDA